MSTSEHTSLRDISAKRVRVLRQGTEALPVKVSDFGSQFLAAPEEQASRALEQALAHVKPMKAVQALPSQVFYLALKKASPEALVAALEHCSVEQWERLVDYDCWSAGRLRMPTLASWLLLHRAMDGEGKKFLQRFRDLGEEIQVASVCSQFELINEDEFDKLKDADRDPYVPLPGNAGYYRTTTSDERVQEFYDALINAAFQNDMHFAFAMLGHGAYSPPQEAEFQALQFRKARLEEDGFVDEDEALGFWKPTAQMRKDAKSFLERLSEPKRQGATSKDISLAQRSEQHLAQVSQAAMFIDRCLDGVDLDADNQAVLQQKLLVFSNSMASATGFEVFELGRSQKSLELAKGTLSLGLEVLANRDAAAGAGILLKESWQKIYQVGTALVDQLRSEAIQMIQSVFPSEADSLREYHDSRSFGKALMWIDQKLNGPLEPQHCDLLKGFFNRFPLAGSLEPQNKQSQANQVEEMQLVGDIEALLELWSDVSCVLLLAQYLAANSSVNLTNMSEALRSTLVLSTRHGEQKTKDWGLSVTQSDLEQWQGLQLADKALKVRKLMASIQNTIPSMDVDESKLALIIGDVLGGSEFSLMKSGECFYAFG